jgi:hypothetical protein
MCSFKNENCVLIRKEDQIFILHLPKEKIMFLSFLVL